MLTAAQINENKDAFLQLISQIDIPNANTQGLVDFLFSSDFFTAPASTIYHCNFEGGLCYHSLNVYKSLVKLTNEFTPEHYSNSCLLVVGLLHDLAKVNFYEKYIMNKKVYDPKGSKHDNQGNFDWFAQEAYKVKDSSERFLGGEHGFNSMMLVNQYIPLTYEETLAIMHHHFMEESGYVIKDMTPICNKYSLVPLLHAADLLATYVIEKDSRVN